MNAIFLDIETTGLNIYKHRTVEIAFKIVDVFSGREQATYHTIVYQPDAIWENRDPRSMDFNGMSHEKLLQGKNEESVKQDIIDIFTRFSIKRGAALYICQNPAFDKSFFSQIISSEIQESLRWPYHWLDLASMYWATRMHQQQTEKNTPPTLIDLSKNGIASFYGLPPESTPHCALNGVNHLIDCYKHVIGFSV